MIDPATLAIIARVVGTVLDGIDLAIGAKVSADALNNAYSVRAHNAQRDLTDDERLAVDTLYEIERQKAFPGTQPILGSEVTGAESAAVSGQIPTPAAPPTPATPAAPLTPAAVTPPAATIPAVAPVPPAIPAPTAAKPQSTSPASPAPARAPAAAK